MPESQIRRLLAHQFHISESNVFGILEKIGGDCAGAISLLSINEPSTQSGDYIPLTEEELDNIVTTLPKHPLLADRNLRLSLAGAQDKLPIYMKENQIYLTQGPYRVLIF